MRTHHLLEASLILILLVSCDKPRATAAKTNAPSAAKQVQASQKRPPTASQQQPGVQGAAVLDRPSDQKPAALPRILAQDPQADRPILASARPPQPAGGAEMMSAHQEGQKPWDPQAGSATIKGVVRFKGKPKKKRLINMSSDMVCQGMHKEKMYIVPVALNADGTLRNVFVWIKKGLESWKFPVPTKPVVIDQKGCEYHPHIQGVFAGQPIIVRNSDPTTHNIEALPRHNLPFNISQPKQGSEKTVYLKRPEVMVKLKCDIHTWMGGYLGVVSNPFYAVTGDGGTYELGKLPPGTYTIAAWQEAYGLRKKTVTLKAGETQTIDFLYTPHRRHHRHRHSSKK